MTARKAAPIRRQQAMGGCRQAVVIAAAAAMLAGCLPDQPYTSPSFPFQTRYHGAKGAPVLLDNQAWWQGFGDPVLNQLIATALQGNLSLAIATARIAQAEAAAKATPGLFSLTGSGQILAAGVGQSAPSGQGSATLNLGWLLDPYGRNRAETRSAAAGIEVAEAELAAARLLVLNNLGSAYVDLRYRQTLLALAEREMRGRRETLAMTRTLLAAKDATKLDITRTQARVAELEAQLPGLRAAVRAQQNQISVLVGVAPGSLGISLDQQRGQPRPRLSPDVGIPADLLRNRPDIRIAERRYYIALAGLTKSQAALYPQLSLAGAITLNGAEGGQSASSYYFGPALQLPSLTARAGVSGARAQIAAAHAEWKSSVLSALLEVENALLDYQAASQALNASDKAAALYRESLGLTRTVFAQGDATLGDLIDAEQAVAAAERAQAETLYQRGLSYVALNIRLGAGHGVTVASAP